MTTVTTLMWHTEKLLSFSLSSIFSVLENTFHEGRLVWIITLSWMKSSTFLHSWSNCLFHMALVQTRQYYVTQCLQEWGSLPVPPPHLPSRFSLPLGCASLLWFSVYLSNTKTSGGHVSQMCHLCIVIFMAVCGAVGGSVEDREGEWCWNGWKVSQLCGG